jgi:hypothetical protein
VPASNLRYHRHASGRCDPGKPDTAVHVALIVDHSGSTSGLVDPKTGLEMSLAALGADIPLNAESYMSDPNRVRVAAAAKFIDLLNPHDKLITYTFDGQAGVQVVCSDGTPDGDEAIATLPFKAPGPNQQTACFGRVADVAKRHKTGLDLQVGNGGNGRAAIWQATQEAYTFLTGPAAQGNSGEPAGRAKHIVLLVDGPDTCTASETFTFRDLMAKPGTAGKCRLPCGNATARFDQMLDQMAQDGWPVAVHVVQFQSLAYREPDARLQELACRSQGTSRFVNTEETNKADPDSHNRITRALSRVRWTLAGSWRIAFPHTALVAADGAAKVGGWTALQGSLHTSGTRFASLATLPWRMPSALTLRAWRTGDC